MSGRWSHQPLAAAPVLDLPGAQGHLSLDSLGPRSDAGCRYASEPQQDLDLRFPGGCTDASWAHGVTASDGGFRHYERDSARAKSQVAP